MESPQAIIVRAEQEASAILSKLPETMTYHNIYHTRDVADAAERIGTYLNISPDEMEMLLIAAWFHDTGFVTQYDNHEEESARFARNFLQEINYPESKIEKICDCILSTKIDQKPRDLLEFIIHDADFIHLTRKSYFEKLILLKKEIEAATGKKYDDITWYEENFDFLKNHRFYTNYGEEILKPKLQDVLRQQQKLIKRLRKQQNELIGENMNLDERRVKELKKKLEKVEGRPERGIETMFRLTSRNHIQLSSMADSKANILISVNAIVISIIMSGFLKALDTHPYLVIPTYTMLTINVVTIVFSIIVLRPNITKGKFTRKDIENRDTNLLFFGNFHSMQRDDYKWGMTEMLNDSHYLYSSLIDDIYFLGRVLGKKYRFLRLAYNFFMMGIILSVIAYLVANFIYLHGVSQ